MWAMNEHLVPHMYDNVRTDSLREAEKLGLLRREPLFKSIRLRRTVGKGAMRLGRWLIDLGTRLERLDTAPGAA